jgi:hypothetical protein
MASGSSTAAVCRSRHTSRLRMHNGRACIELAEQLSRLLEYASIVKNYRLLICANTRILVSSRNQR